MLREVDVSAIFPRAHEEVEALELDVQGFGGVLDAFQAGARDVLVAGVAADGEVVFAVVAVHAGGEGRLAFGREDGELEAVGGWVDVRVFLVAALACPDGFVADVKGVLELLFSALGPSQSRKYLSNKGNPVQVQS